MAIGYCNCVVLWEYLAYFWSLAWNTCHKWRFTNWHHTNRVCKFGFPDMMVETWSSSVSSYFCGSAAYNPVGGNLFWRNIFLFKVSFFGMCSKMQIIPIKNLNIKKVVPQFLWFFRLKCWFKGQIISRIHLNLPNAYKLICFDRNINGNMDVKFLIAIIGHCTNQRKWL